MLAEIADQTGGITFAKGFVAGGLHCGAKKDKLDLAIVKADSPCSAAAVFTTNRVKAAPVLVGMERLASGACQALVINSGHANACTGPEGIQAAREMAARCGRELGVPDGLVVPFSTGVIGVLPPLDRIGPGIARLAPLLSPEGGRDAAAAIMTTDSRSKESAVEFTMDGVPVRIGGMAKGSGMIHPNMATMLAFISTDAAIVPSLLQRALRRVVRRSFNMISVDGDTSTNDTVVVLAGGASGAPLIDRPDRRFRSFQEALEQVAVSLAKQIARDGEGATRLIEVRVAGARTYKHAATVARSIVSSNLVKTAVYGADPNWGRILCAAGYAGVSLDPARISVRLGKVLVCKGGVPVDFDEAEAAAALRGEDVAISLDLGVGLASARAWGCDLTEKYVHINGSYRT